MKEQSVTNKIALRGMLVAVAFVLSWVEAQVPVFFAVPGMKLGLTNLVVLTALYCLSEKDAFAINVVRIILAGFTFGSLSSMIYSLAGGLLSTIGMIGLKRMKKFSTIGVSVAGGVLHNLGQIIVAMIVLQTRSIMYYLVVLWISGIVAGCVIGLLGGLVIKRLPTP